MLKHSLALALVTVLAIPLGVSAMMKAKEIAGLSELLGPRIANSAFLGAYPSYTSSNSYYDRLSETAQTQFEASDSLECRNVALIKCWKARG